MKKLLLSLIIATNLASPIFATELPINTAPVEVGTAFSLLNVLPAEKGLPNSPINKLVYQDVLDGILMTPSGNLPGGMNMFIDAEGPISDIPVGSIVTLRLQFDKSYHMPNNVGETKLNVVMSNNIASNKNIEIVSPAGSVTFTDATPLGELKTMLLKFKMPASDIDIKKDLKFTYSLGDIELPSGTSFSLLNAKPGSSEKHTAFIGIPSALYKDVLEGKLITKSGKLPSGMTVNIKVDNQNITPNTMIPAGSAVSLQLQMFSEYAILNGAGTTNLEVTLSSPAGIKIVNPVNVQSFTDAKTLGSVKVLNFDFIMPEHDVDMSKDFKFGFALK